MSDKVNVKLTLRQAATVLRVLDGDLAAGDEGEPDRDAVLAARRRISVACDKYDGRNGIERPKWTDLFGSAPNFTGGMDIDEYLEQSRGEA